MRRLAWSLACLPGVASAAGWTQPAGDSYLKLNNRLLVGERGYDRDGRAHDTGGAFHDWQLQLYGELGLTDRWTLIAFATPVGWARFEDAPETPPAGRVARSAFYVGAVGAGLRRGLSPLGPLHLAAQLTADAALPVGDADVGAGRFACEAPPCDRFRYAPTVARVDADAEVQAGLALPAGFWLSATGGLRVTALADIDPALRAAGQLGWSGPLGLVLEAHVQLHHPLGNIDESVISGAGETAYRGQGLSVGWWITPAIGLNAGMDGARGVRSNAAAPVRTLGIELRPHLLGATP
ncbi:MAG: hypothetical protein R3F60_02505 [bacterium]